MFSALAKKVLNRQNKMERYSSILAKDKGLFSEPNTQAEAIIITSAKQELSPEKTIRESCNGTVTASKLVS